MITGCCSRVLPRQPSHLNPISSARCVNPIASVRCVGFSNINKKTTFKRQDWKLPSITQSKSKKYNASRSPAYHGAYAETPHNVPQLITSMEPQIAHQLYSKFCLDILRNYGFELEFQGAQKSFSRLGGQWNLPGHNFSVVAACSLISELSNTRNNHSILSKPQDAGNTVGILINNVGFKAATLRKFVESENPCILLSLFDRTENWMKREPSEAHYRPERVQKCLHNQLWDARIGFSTYKFGVSDVTIPACNMTQGMSLCLFNKAFASIAPTLSPGKVIFQRPNTYQCKEGLRSKFQSTIMVETKAGDKSKKMDLCDVLDGYRQEQLGQYYIQQRRMLTQDMKRSVKLEDTTVQSASSAHPSSDIDYSQLMYEYVPMEDIYRTWES